MTTSRSPQRQVDTTSTYYEDDREASIPIMNLEQHAKCDHMKVWLSTSGEPSEVDLLLEAATDANQRIAFALGARCGLQLTRCGGHA